MPPAKAKAQPSKEDTKRSWYIGAYVTRELQQSLKSEAREQKRSASQQLILILEERYAIERTTNGNQD